MGRLICSPEPRKERSRTFEGIAQAMARQWGNAAPEIQLTFGNLSNKAAG
jgi:hypothetical protein